MKAKVLPEAYLDLVKHDFERALGGVEPGSGPGSYNPSEGFFVILEPGDNVRNLEVIGLNPEDRGLLGSAPEVVDLLEPEPGLQVYQILVAYNNSCLMSFYIEKSSLDAEVEAWLQENLIDFGESGQEAKDGANEGTRPETGEVPF